MGSNYGGNLADYWNGECYDCYEFDGGGRLHCYCVEVRYDCITWHYD